MINYQHLQLVRPCTRCGHLAEPASAGALHIFGKGFETYLCQDCRQLAVTGSPRFWDEGWNALRFASGWEKFLYCSLTLPTWLLYLVLRSWLLSCHPWHGRWFPWQTWASEATATNVLLGIYFWCSGLIGFGLLLNLLRYLT